MITTKSTTTTINRKNYLLSLNVCEMSVLGETLLSALFDLVHIEPKEKVDEN